jgi:hypothetical protein
MKSLSTLSQGLLFGLTVVHSAVFVRSAQACGGFLDGVCQTVAKGAHDTVNTVSKAGEDTVNTITKAGSDTATTITIASQQTFPHWGPLIPHPNLNNPIELTPLCWGLENPNCRAEAAKHPLPPPPQYVPPTVTNGVPPQYNYGPDWCDGPAYGGTTYPPKTLVCWGNNRDEQVCSGHKFNGQSSPAGWLPTGRVCATTHDAAASDGLVVADYAIVPDPYKPYSECKTMKMAIPYFDARSITLYRSRFQLADNVFDTEICHVGYK